VCDSYWTTKDSAWKKHWGPHRGLLWIHCPRGDIARAVAKISKDRASAVLVVPMGPLEEESTRDWVLSLETMTLNKTTIPEGESVYQDAMGQALPPQRWRTSFHCVDGSLDQEGSQDSWCVNRIVAEPWRLCFAATPEELEEPVDRLSDEEILMIQGYMDRPFHDQVQEGDAKAREKAWWQVDNIVSGAFEGNTFIRRVSDHMAEQDEPVGANPPTYGDIYRTRGRDGPIQVRGLPPVDAPREPHVSSVVQVPPETKTQAEECSKIQAMRARLKEKYAASFFSGKPIFPPPV